METAFHVVLFGKPFSRAVVLKQVTFSLPSGTLGSVWRYDCLDSGAGTGDIQWVEARDAAKHPTRHRTDTQQRLIRPQRSAVLLLRTPAAEYKD